MKWLIPFLLFYNALSSFEGLLGRPLDLLSLFLPAEPTILAMNIHPKDTENLMQRWPKGHILRELSKTDRADLLWLRAEELYPDSDLLSGARAIYLDALLSSSEKIQLKDRLERAGFTLINRWNQEGIRDSSIFVNKNYFYSPEVGRYLDQNSVFSGGYDIYGPNSFYSWYGLIRYYVDDDEDDSVKLTVKTSHAYEGNLSLLIHALTKPETVAIDMGAHMGVHTVFMSRKAGPLGAVIAFEPNKKLYMELLANMELNDCKNVISICKGLGNERKTVYQHRIEIEQNDLLEGTGDPIDIVPLDDYFFNSVSLIKMDVENYEYFILQGAKDTILRNRPVIIFESWISYEPEKRNQETQRQNFERVMSLIESYGYEIYIIYNCDFLAIPSETEDELLLKHKQRLKKLDPKTYTGEPDPSFL